MRARPASEESLAPASRRELAGPAAVSRSRIRYAPFAALAGLMAAASALILVKGRGLTFFYDEWAWVMRRRGWSVDTFLEPHNEHLSLLPVTVFKLLFVTAGLSHYWVYRVVGLLFHLACVTLLFLLVRRRVGDWLGVALVTPVLFLGMAWHDLLAPFQIGFLGSVAAGLGMLLALERGDPAGDVAACVLLAISFSSSGLGILFAAAALVELLWRRNRVRGLWVVVAPLVLYGAWYLAYGHSDAMRSNIPAVPAYTAQAAAGAAGALLGLGAEWGVPLVVLLVWLGVVRISRGGATPLLTAAVAGALTFWGLTALSRAQLNDPDASRYLYPGAVLVVLVVAELARGARLQRAQATAVAVLVAASVLASYGALRDGAAGLQDSSSYVRAELGALQVAGTTVDPSYQPDPMRAPDIRAGQYLDAIRGLGPAGDSPKRLRREGELQRQTADQVLARALGVSLSPAPAELSPAGAAPSPERSSTGSVSKAGACLVFRPTGEGALIDVPLPAEGVVVAPESGASVAFAARSFADGFAPTPLGTIQGSSAQLLQIGPGQTAVDWHLELLPSGQARICAAPHT